MKNHKKFRLGVTLGLYRYEMNLIMQMYMRYCSN